MRHLFAFALIALLLAPGFAHADEPFLHPHLAPLAPFLGKTYRGEMAESTPEKPVFDVTHYERTLNGMAVRNLHSINDGDYCGESLVFWDPAAESLVYYYFTSAGFYTHGTMTVEEGKYVAHEMVTGGAGGITEVRSSGELHPDGSLHTRSEYLKDGQWVPGHAGVYREAPDAKVVMR